MALYLTLRQHPALASLSNADRQHALRKGLSRLNGWRQVVLNIAKLILLVPPFLFLAWQPGLKMVLVMAIWLVGYVLVLRPLQMLLAGDLIATAARERTPST